MNDSTKRMYKLGKGTYTVKLSFPDIGENGIEYNTDVFEKDKFSLTESLMNGDSLEFVGCISSYLQVQIHGANANLEGERVIASIDIDGEDDPMQIFAGYVKSSKTRSDLAYKELVCYDSLWKKVVDKDVSQWYNTAPFPMSMKDLRDSFFEYVGIEQEETELCNDDVVISKEYARVQRMNALDVAKSICQFNAVCGIMDGETDTFVYIVPESINNEANDTIEDNFFYKSMQYEEYVTNKITRVEVRDDEDAESYAYGTGTNKYIIQGNMFVFGLSSNAKKEICENIYNQIKNFQYRPVSYDAPGLPFSKLGTVQMFKVLDWLDGNGTRVNRSFTMLSRTLEGIQELTNKVDIKGRRNQTEFVTDIRAQLEVIKRTTQELKNTSSKIIDYILPSDIEEASIASGESSNIETFSFYNSSAGEKSSFYSEVSFNITTDSTDTSFGDCVLTVTIKLNGLTMLTEQHAYGDGKHILFLNYLLQDLTKGNHSLKVYFALSGGEMSQIDIESAYLLAASIIEDITGGGGSGDWEEYDILDDNGDWSYDVLPDNFNYDALSLDKYNPNMVKISTVSSGSFIYNLQEWYLSEYILWYRQSNGVRFFRTQEGHFTQENNGHGVSGTNWCIPIKRVSGYTRLRYTAKNKYRNTAQYNTISCGCAAIVDGQWRQVVDWNPNGCAPDWRTFEVDISSLPYVDYIIFVGYDYPPIYKDVSLGYRA